MVGLESQAKKILVIKLGASGDVLRTTPILSGLKKKYPQSSVTWLTRKESLDLLQNNHLISRLLSYSPATAVRLKRERFDILISLDKEDEATTLAMEVAAKRKIGFGLDTKTGKLAALNKESLYAWRLGICDELKFRRNKKTYPEIIFEMASLKYQHDEYILNLDKSEKAYAKRLLSKIGLKANDFIIGLNTGSGTRFAHKSWTEKGFVDLIGLIRANTLAKPLLLGGPQEARRNAAILSKTGNLAYDAGCKQSLGQFAAVVGSCSLVVSGDTTALHIAIALKKKVVALFGSTCSQEIELYGRGKKICADIKCRPCYKQECERRINCMNSIKPAEVFQAIESLLF